MFAAVAAAAVAVAAAAAAGVSFLQQVASPRKPQSPFSVVGSAGGGAATIDASSIAAVFVAVAVAVAAAACAAAGAAAAGGPESCQELFYGRLLLSQLAFGLQILREGGLLIVTLFDSFSDFAVGPLLVDIYKCISERSICLSLLSIYLSICLPISLSISLSIYIYIYRLASIHSL